jgi:Regulator of chromosome condensation (RCC1) repeat/PEP-CTERM motif
MRLTARGIGTAFMLWLLVLCGTSATAGGPVVGWGEIPSPYDYGQATPPDSVNGTDGTATAIAAGGLHSCAIQAGTQAVVCWGWDTGPFGSQTPPDSVNGSSGTASAIASGGPVGTYMTGTIGSEHSCAIQAESGAVVCWGLNEDGEAIPPPSVNGTAGTATAISAGSGHSCAIQAGSGAVVCWGDIAAPPDSVNGTSGTARAISAGGISFNPHACAIEAETGAVVCWGYEDSLCTVLDPPGSVDGTGGTATAIAVGACHACAIQEETGAVVCWASFLGDSSGQATPPDSVNGTAGTATAISAGAYHSCAIQAGSGKVVCWGDIEAPPDSVNGTAGSAAAISTRWDFTLAIAAPEPDALFLGLASLGALATVARRRLRTPTQRRSQRCA